MGRRSRKRRENLTTRPQRDVARRTATDRHRPGRESQGSRAPHARGESQGSRAPHARGESQDSRAPHARRTAAASDRPRAPWGSFPLSEIVILAGIVVIFWGLLGGGGQGNERVAAGLVLASLGGGELALR